VTSPFCSLALLLALYVFKALKSVRSLTTHVGRTVVTGLFVVIHSPPSLNKPLKTVLHKIVHHDTR
jgi:hypothetical protein